MNPREHYYSEVFAIVVAYFVLFSGNLEEVIKNKQTNKQFSVLLQHSELICNTALTPLILSVVSIDLPNPFDLKLFYSRNDWNFESTVGLTKQEALNKCFVKKMK